MTHIQGGNFCIDDLANIGLELSDLVWWQEALDIIRRDIVKRKLLFLNTQLLSHISKRPLYPCSGIKMMIHHNNSLRLNCFLEDKLCKFVCKIMRHHNTLPKNKRTIHG